MRRQITIATLFVNVLWFSAAASSDERCEQLKYQGVMTLVVSIGISDQSDAYTRCIKQMLSQKNKIEIDRSYLTNQESDKHFRTRHSGLDPNNVQFNLYTDNQNSRFRTVDDASMINQAPVPENAIQTLRGYKSVTE